MPIPSFRYTPAPARVYAGRDTLSHLRAEVERAGARRAFVVCGRTVAQHTGLLERVRSVLGDRYAGAFAGVARESPLPAVEAGVEAARAAGADLIVAVGGGSAVVTARAITILMAEEGSAHDLCTQYPPDGPPVSPRLLRPKLPNVVVLTTPTTAANRAGAAVLDPTARRRLELFDPKVRPVAVIVDAEALLTAPLALFRSTAVSTFCGAVEALPFPVVNALSHADLRQAVELCRTFLPRLLEHPDDVDARLQLAAAALLSNRASDAMGGGGYGVATGLVHQLQARCGVDQGAALAVLTRPGLRFNREALAPGQARLAAALGVWREGMSPAEAGEAAEEEVAALLGSVGMPLRLRELGVPEAELPALAAGGLESFFVRTNPRPVTGPEALLALLREAW